MKVLDSVFSQFRKNQNNSCYLVGKNTVRFVQRGTHVTKIQMIFAISVEVANVT